MLETAVGFLFLCVLVEFWITKSVFREFEDLYFKLNSLENEIKIIRENYPLVAEVNFDFPEETSQ